MSRVLALADLANAAAAWRRDGAVVVLAHGCFDPLHLGHVRHLEAARALGNVLVVSVTDDVFVNKGPGRPRSPAAHRAGVAAALRCVDAAVVCPAATALPVVAALRPHVLAKGAEYAGRPTARLALEVEAVSAHGGRVEFVSGDVVCSSTAILAGVA